MLLETTLVLWLFVFLLMSAFDFGRVLYQQILVSHAAYEGARTASMTIGLTQSARIINLPDHGTLETRFERCRKTYQLLTGTERESCGLLLAQFRTYNLLLHSDIHIQKDSLVVTTEFDSRGTVAVTVTARYQALFPLYNVIPIRASSKLPYLVVGRANPGKIAGG